MKSARKYRLTLQELSHLRRLWSITLSRRGVIALAVAALLLASGAIVAFLAFNPIRRSETPAPGEMTTSELMRLSGRLDSLRQVQTVQELYLENLREVSDTGRVPSDSLQAGVLLAWLPIDSLAAASPAERQFAARMSDRERYNLRGLAQEASQGLTFSNPVPGGIMASEGGGELPLRMIVPADCSVRSVAEGVVVEARSSESAQRGRVIVQHSGGFMSCYTTPGEPLVAVGDAVRGGQALSVPAAAGSRVKPMAIVELWNDGRELRAADYVPCGRP